MTPESEGLASLVVSQIWQVTAVAAIAGLAASLFCRRRPRLAYLLGLVVLAKCWVPPTWSSPIGLFCWPGQEQGLAPENPSRRVSDAERPTKIETPGEASPLAVGPVDTEAAELEYDDLPREPRATSLAMSLGGIWLSGALGLASFALIQNWCWRKRLGPFISFHGRSPDLLTSELANRVGLWRRPRVRISAAAAGPAVFGLLRPTIVLPAPLLTNRIESRLEMVLAHEMVHIRRGDLMVGTVQWITQIVWWFNPLIWLTCRQLTRERERCCDEDVLALLRCPPASYAQCLLDVLRLSRGLPVLPAFPGMSAVDITRRRFEHILRCPTDARRHTRAGYCLLALALLGIVLPGAPLTKAAPPAREAAGRNTNAVGEEPQETTSQVPQDPSSSAPDDELKKDSRKGNLRQVDDTPRQAAADNPEVEPSPELRQAIDRGVNFLKAAQQNDGHWADPIGYPGGITAMCTLALVRSGVKPEDRCIRRAVDYLRHLSPTRTYSTALQTMVFCAVDPGRDRERIQQNVDWLCAQQKVVGPFVGAWAYPEAEGDNSNTGFAIMALYEAEQAGVKAPAAVWRLALDYWLNSQNPNGSWGYKPQTGGTGTMTATGLFSTAVATKVLDERRPDQPGPKAIDRATGWIARNFSATSNPGSGGVQNWWFYYLHAVGRAGRATGQQKLGDHDWYAEGAKALLAQQQFDGSWRGTGHAEDDPHVATSWALLFLAQGGEHAR
ncbi:MAG TPA: M56 family metallopeptidase [Pirellulales bacterium]|nr:M56 family metallopeptidase [Pirellulales bacterium]